jgi:hypothetical protein
MERNVIMYSIKNREKFIVLSFEFIVCQQNFGISDQCVGMKESIFIRVRLGQNHFQLPEQSLPKAFEV